MDDDPSKQNGRAPKQKNKKKLRSFSFRKNFSKSKRQSVTSPKFKHPQAPPPPPPDVAAPSTSSPPPKKPEPPSPDANVDANAPQNESKQAHADANATSPATSAAPHRSTARTQNSNATSPAGSTGSHRSANANTTSPVGSTGRHRSTARAQDVASRIAAEMPEIDTKNVTDDQLLHLLLNSRKIAKQRNKVEELHRGKMVCV